MNERLRNARKAAGFASATDAIEYCKWRGSTYRAHENGQNNFNAEYATKYGRAYGVSASWLLLGEGDEEKVVAKKDKPLTTPEDKSEVKEGKTGLWDNIHAKRERIKHGSSEHMRKPGSKGAPTAQAFKDASEEYTGAEKVSSNPVNNTKNSASFSFIKTGPIPYKGLLSSIA